MVSELVRAVQSMLICSMRDALCGLQQGVKVARLAPQCQLQ